MTLYRLSKDETYIEVKPEIHNLRIAVKLNVPVEVDHEGVRYRIPPTVLREAIALWEFWSNVPDRWNAKAPLDVGRIYLTQMKLIPPQQQ